jgi:hypothetical protein
VTQRNRRRGPASDQRRKASKAWAMRIADAQNNENCNYSSKHRRILRNRHNKMSDLLHSQKRFGWTDEISRRVMISSNIADESRDEVRRSSSVEFKVQRFPMALADVRAS